MRAALRTGAHAWSAAPPGTDLKTFRQSEQVRRQHAGRFVPVGALAYSIADDVIGPRISRS